MRHIHGNEHKAFAVMIHNAMTKKTKNERKKPKPKTKKHSHNELQPEKLLSNAIELI